MNSEDTFRLILAVHAAVLLPVAAYHRIRSFTGEPLRRRDEGLWILIPLRGLGVAMAGFACYVADPALMRWSAVTLPVVVRWAGLPLLWGAGAWTVWMFRTLGPNLTDTVNARAAATLVTHGPYAWVRHPTYVGIAGVVASCSLLAANAFTLAAGLTAVALLLVRSRTEEAKLEERFGAEYVRYRERTGMLLPRFPARLAR